MRLKKGNPVRGCTRARTNWYQRRISIILGVLAYLAPTLWLWCQYRLAADPRSGCGLWALFAYFWGSAIALFLSAGATWLGTVAWRRLKGPRPWHRHAEVAAFALPGVGGLLVICLIMAA